MALFILFQTDIRKNKISRVVFGIFYSRPKAIECAKHNDKFGPNTKVFIEEITPNIFEEI